MLRLPSFTYRQPRTLAEAVSMKADAGPDGMYVAGGTDLYPNMKRRHQEPRTVISLDRKSTRLNSSHGYISYAVFCLKKKKKHPGSRGVQYCLLRVYTLHWLIAGGQQQTRRHLSTSA